MGFKPNPTAPQTESHRSSVTSHRQKESEIIMMDAKTTNLTSRPPNVFIADAFYLNVCEAINHFPTEGDPDDLADGYLTIYSFYSCVTPSVWGGFREWVAGLGLLDPTGVGCAVGQYAGPKVLLQGFSADFE